VGVLSSVLENNREEVVYTWAESQMTDKDQDHVKLLIAAAARSNWWKESVLATIIMVGAGFLIHSYIPAAISSQTAAIASDVSSTKTDVGNLKTSVSSIQADMSGIRNDVKEALKDALSRAYKKVAQPSPNDDIRERRAGLRLGGEAITLAQGMTTLGATLDARDVAKFGLEAAKLTGSSILHDDAWRVTALTVDYTSANATQNVDWIGPVEPFENGFHGLFGITEMAHVRIFGSKSRVPLQQATLVTTFRIESSLLKAFADRGYTTFPEFSMLVGQSGSNIVLDNLHMRNVVVKNISVSYGGGRALLENVSFIDCKFHMVESQGAVLFSKQLLDSDSRNITLAHLAE
jgi:hypothetical protein